MIGTTRAGIGFRLLAAAMIGLLAPAARGAEAAGAMPLQAILTDSELWGDSGLAAIAAIGYWSRLGETSLAIYSDKVVAGTPFASQEDAKQGLASLSKAMKRALPRLRGTGVGVFAMTPQAHASMLRSEPIGLIEDDSLRIGWKGEDGTFLKKNVIMQAVMARYGKPQKTTSEVVHAQGDRRPAILTVHEYANGAVKFVQSDQSLTPANVDRVVLDVKAVTQALYASEP